MKTKRKNRVLCKLCLDIIESKHCHDYVTCSCEAVSVDGGKDYFKRTGNPENMVELTFPENLIYVTPSIKEPNKETLKSFSDYENKIGLTKCGSVEELFEKLREKEATETKIPNGHSDHTGTYISYDSEPEPNFINSVESEKKARIELEKRVRILEDLVERLPDLR